MFWSVLALWSHACLFSLSFFVCDKQEEKAEQRIKQVFSKCQPLYQFGQDRLLVGFGFPTFWNKLMRIAQPFSLYHSWPRKWLNEHS
jgi:hypothetical protein